MRFAFFALISISFCLGANLCLEAQADDNGSPYSRSERQLIPDIVDLPNGASVPNQIFLNYDSRAIGESIVEHLYRINDQFQEIGTGEIPAYNYLKDTELQLYFPQNATESILQSGFLNLHQTGYSKGGGQDTLRRMQKEDAVSMLKLGGNSGEWGFVRPKYVNLDLTANRNLGVTISGASQYGDTVAVLKPEVKYRTTWSSHDSLLDGNSIRSLFFRTDKKYIEPTQYFEGQVWGAVDLRDIKEFLVPKWITSENLNLLKATGLPVYSFKEDVSTGRYRRVRDELLYAGDPVKIKKYSGSLLKIRSQYGKKISGDIEGVLTNNDVNDVLFNPKQAGRLAGDEGGRNWKVGDRLLGDDGGRYTVKEIPKSVQSTGFKSAKYYLFTPDRTFVFLKTMPLDVAKTLAKIKSAASDGSEMKEMVSELQIGSDYALVNARMRGRGFSTESEAWRKGASSSRSLEAIQKLVQELAQSGIALDQFSPNDLLWENGHFRLASPEHLIVGLSPEEAESRMRKALGPLAKVVLGKKPIFSAIGAALNCENFFKFLK